MVSLSANSLGFEYSTRRVLEGVTATFAGGEIIALVGPNGAGKSTMLGVLAGLRHPYLGSCQWHGKELHDWKRRDFARDVSFVPQQLQVEFPFTAGQVALMGRSAFGDGMFESEEDIAAAEEAMRMTDSLEFRDRDFRALSGGERQRVVLASALAQSPKVLLLDEPTTFLDLKHQLAIYELLAKLRDEGMLILTATHDLNLAASYADRVLVLQKGKPHSFGPARDVLTVEMIESVFETRCQLIPMESGGNWIAYGR